MIPRPHVIQQIARALTIHPVAALLGPRQCGKTTVARLFAEREPSTYCVTSVVPASTTVPRHCVLSKVTECSAVTPTLTASA
jgi:hypothetical protein